MALKVHFESLCRIAKQTVLLSSACIFLLFCLVFNQETVCLLVYPLVCVLSYSVCPSCTRSTEVMPVNPVMKRECFDHSVFVVSGKVM